MRTIKRDIVGGFVFSIDGKLLLGLMDPRNHGAYAGLWVVPGGGVDAAETKEQALVREFIEETGIDLSSYDIRFVDNKYTDDVETDEREKTLKDTGERVLASMRFNNHEVHIDKQAAEVHLKPNEEFEKLKWFALTDLPVGNLAAGVSAALKRWGYTEC